MGAIYGLYDPNGELRYVGQTATDIEARYRKHLGDYASGSPKARWINSLLAEGLRPTVGILEGDVPNKDLRSRENAWILRSRTEGCDLTNATLGQGFQSDETRKKRSTALKGKPWSEKRREAYRTNAFNPRTRIYRPSYGRQVSDDTRARMKEAKTADRAILRSCPFCSRLLSGKLGLSIHVTKTHQVSLRQLLRIAVIGAPERTKAILAQIEECDSAITHLLKEIAKS